LRTWNPVREGNLTSEFYNGLLQQSEFMRRWHAQLQGTKESLRVVVCMAISPSRHADQMRRLA
jgi:hypothetical protein